MYAIVDVKDKQFKVRENDTLYVPYHADAEVDETLTLDRVLLLSNGDGDTTLGTPTVDGATVTARVVDHVKGDKVIVFKKKRRKRYRVKKGHRQQYTQIHIESLNADGAAPPPADDETEEPAEDESPGAAETADAESPESEAPETEAEDAETADAADAETEEVEATKAPGGASEAAEETAENAETEETEASDDEEAAKSKETDEAESEEEEGEDEEKNGDSK
jgi:large subunit ribosomal protein L21